MPTLARVRQTRDYTQGGAKLACHLLRYIVRHQSQMAASTYGTAHADYTACLASIIPCLVALCDALNIEDV
jgi:hypothetical protein